MVEWYVAAPLRLEQPAVVSANDKMQTISTPGAIALMPLVPLVPLVPLLAVCMM